MISQTELDMIPNDLKIKLSGFAKPELAGRFFKYLGNMFTVYSSSVEKVYTDYESEMVGTENKLLVVNPNFERFDSIFSYIDNDAITPTGIRIILADKDGVKSVFMIGPCANTGKTICYALKDGLLALMEGKFQGGAFLPVLKLGDLSELPNASVPVISVHRINPKALKYRSEFEINDLSNTIKENISRLVG